MTHRRAFLRGVGGMLGAAAVAPLVSLDEAWGRTVGRVAPDRMGDDPTGESLAARLREEYLLGPDVVYLNHASIGTVPRVVHEAHKAYLAVCETNPWLYMWGGAWEEPRAAVRAKAAAALGCEAAEVAITHNTTEGFNLIAQGLPLGRGDEVLFSSLNHDGASVCFEHHAAAKGYSVRRFAFPIERAPELTADEIIGLHLAEIRPETRLLAFPHVDNIVGIRHPMAELATAARAAGVEFIAVDGAQTVGALGLDVAASGVDFYMASPHKWVQSPKGLGLLYARAEASAELRPMWVTWGQRGWGESARRFEDYGTRNLPELLALGDALEFQEMIGYPAKEARHRHQFGLLRDLARATPGFGWRSPPTWAAGGPLVGIEIDDVPAGEFGRRMSGGGYVFRPFQTQGLNSVRLSPNVMTSDGELTRFFEDGVRALADG